MSEKFFAHLVVNIIHVILHLSLPACKYLLWIASDDLFSSQAVGFAKGGFGYLYVCFICICVLFVFVFYLYLCFICICVLLVFVFTCL